MATPVTTSTQAAMSAATTAPVKGADDSTNKKTAEIAQLRIIVPPSALPLQPLPSPPEKPPLHPSTPRGQSSTAEIKLKRTSPTREVRSVGNSPRKGNSPVIKPGQYGSSPNPKLTAAMQVHFGHLHHFSLTSSQQKSPSASAIPSFDPPPLDLASSAAMPTTTTSAAIIPSSIQPKVGKTPPLSPQFRPTMQTLQIPPLPRKSSPLQKMPDSSPTASSSQESVSSATSSASTSAATTPTAKAGKSASSIASSQESASTTPPTTAGTPKYSWLNIGPATT